MSFWNDQFYDEFCHDCPHRRVHHSLLDALLFLTQSYTIELSPDVSSCFALIYCELLEDRYGVLFILASPDILCRYRQNTQNTFAE